MEYLERKTTSTKNQYAMMSHVNDAFTLIGKLVSSQNTSKKQIRSNLDSGVSNMYERLQKNSFKTIYPVNWS